MADSQTLRAPDGCCYLENDEQPKNSCQAAPVTPSSQSVQATASGRVRGFISADTPVRPFSNVPWDTKDGGMIKVAADLAQPSAECLAWYSTSTLTPSHNFITDYPIEAESIVCPTMSLNQVTPDFDSLFLGHLATSDFNSISFNYSGTSSSLIYGNLAPDRAPDNLKPAEESSRQDPVQRDLCEGLFAPIIENQDISSVWEPTFQPPIIWPYGSALPILNPMAAESDICLERLFRDDDPAGSNQCLIVHEAPRNSSDANFPISIKATSNSKVRKIGGSLSETLAKRPRTEESLSFEASMINFNVESGEVQRRRRRQKFTVDKRKEYILQRNTGACHQCRFRKRACTLNTPCNYCRTIAGRLSLANHICYRENPFSYRVASDYFLYTSASRTLDFFDDRPIRRTRSLRSISVRPNERGFYSAPLGLEVFDCNINTLSEARRKILRSQAGSVALGSKGINTVTIINESDDSLGDRLEKWAIEYGTAFARTQNHRAGRLLLMGGMWIARNLPEVRDMEQSLQSHN